jgi:hypothetical protein
MSTPLVVTAPRAERPAPADVLADLVRAVVRETDAVRELREALVRQRAGVAADATADVHASCDDIARILVTLEQAKRHRAAVLAAAAREHPPTLEGLAAAFDGALPPPLAEAAQALRREAEGAAREASVNRVVLQRTVEAGEAFLQALFTGTATPDAVYRPGARSNDDDGAGFLLDRTA